MTDHSKSSDQSAQSPVLEITTKYRAKSDNGMDVVEEVIEIDMYEAELLFEQMLRGSLDDVDANTIRTELEARRLI